MSAAQHINTIDASSAKMVVDGVSKRFSLGKGREIQAIAEATFTVEENEICTILGSSGCGKSTVLRMMAGLETPTTGELRLDGHVIAGPDRERGMVFQAYTSFDWLTVRGNVEYGMRINGVPKQERRARTQEFIKLVHLEGFEDAYPSQLSGGMKQRVAIARTLANDPALLLMDEPFGALDAETRWHMQELLVDIAETANTTMVMVTHDIEEAIYLGDKIVFMSSHPGRVHEIIVPEFKQGKRYVSKEQVLGLDGYGDLEKYIMRLMQEQGSKDER
ncbi:ABC transporter ATP-binding protein [Roseovarius pelagicus]|uniref:ABC transporter ATP-binding protein n=1 Tax=Roseovarius pelagicus TaxID=2980108 RepID=A0ABY6D8G4_9RHOB|nr:ABC transporter ATP-binding protein [Roseovarius pelagicus]UXX82406.1 ABC transporter ATP-binding protein [Roseovarius pelagicus]